MKLSLLSAAAIAVVAATPAFAEMATITTNLNVRAGPSSQEPVIGRLGAGETVDIKGCVQRGKWCSVAFQGGEGFVSSRFLAGGFSPNSVMIDEQPTAAIRPSGSPGATAGVVAGGATGAVAGAVVGGPIGAAVGGAAGMVVGGTTGAVIDPPSRVRTYVTSNRYEPVRLQGEYAIGATLPGDVELRSVPDYEYRYVYVNDRPMLVEPGSRRIVYVYD